MSSGTPCSSWYPSHEATTEARRARVVLGEAFGSRPIGLKFEPRLKKSRAFAAISKTNANQRFLLSYRWRSGWGGGGAPALLHPGINN